LWRWLWSLGRRRREKMSWPTTGCEAAPRGAVRR
jgi:hypothetical protein